MKTYDGKIPMNAEINIDYAKKKVSFHFPFKGYKNKSLSYSNSALYNLLFSIFGLELLIIFAIKFTDKYKDYLVDMYIYPLIMMTWTVLMAILIYTTFTKGLTYLIFRFSKLARKNYAKHNAIFAFLRKGKILDLSREMSTAHYIHDNKLVLFDYDIAVFEYTLLTKNKLKRIYTKSLHPKEHKKEHYNFACIFEFKDKIKRGYLFYR